MSELEPRDLRCPYCRLEIRIRKALARYRLRKRAFTHLENRHPDLSLRDRSVTADSMADEALRGEDIPPD